MPTGTASYSNGDPTSAKAVMAYSSGDRRTVVRNPKDELKTGTLHGMLKQLGLSSDDL